jgi:hypothetical protein
VSLTLLVRPSEHYRLDLIGITVLNVQNVRVHHIYLTFSVKMNGGYYFDPIVKVLALGEHEW